MALCMLNEISKKATMIMEETAKLLEAIAARVKEKRRELLLTCLPKRKLDQYKTAQDARTKLLLSSEPVFQSFRSTQTPFSFAATERAKE